VPKWRWGDWCSGNSRSPVRQQKRCVIKTKVTRAGKQNFEPSRFEVSGAHSELRVWNNFALRWIFTLGGYRKLAWFWPESDSQWRCNECFARARLQYVTRACTVRACTFAVIRACTVAIFRVYTFAVIGACTVAILRACTAAIFRACTDVSQTSSDQKRLRQRNGVVKIKQNFLIEWNLVVLRSRWSKTVIYNHQRFNEIIFWTF